MIKKTLSKFKNQPIYAAFVIAFLTYLLFYFPLINQNTLFGPSDSKHKHIPARVYFYESVVNEHRFPFWTEKQYSGFPIYADPENGFLNPVNILSIILFGPILSYKILHITSYIFGSLALYILIKRKGYKIPGWTITNLVYYFSFFTINHSIHYNIVIPAYLFPVNLLLIDLYIKNKSGKFILLQALLLSFTVLWGQVQIAILIALGFLVYLFVFGKSQLSKKALFIYPTIVALLTIILTLPQTIPTYNMYTESERMNSLDYQKGTLNPSLLSVAVHPFLFGRRNVNYLAEYKYSLSYTETYIYMSITAFILSIAGTAFTKQNKIKTLALFYLGIFAILACSAYIPLLHQNTPILTWFRYWVRSAFLASFAVGILAGYFIDNAQNIKINLRFVAKNLLPIICIAAIVVFLYLVNFNNYYPEFNTTYPWKRLLVSDTKIWLMLSAVTLLTTALLLLINKLNYKKKPLTFLLTLLLSGLLFFDLRYYAQDVLDYRVRDISDYIEQPTEEYKNIRVVYKNTNTYGLMFLYQNSWTPFGYSQFVNKDYRELMKEYGLSHQDFGNSATTMQELENFGVRKIIDEDNNVKDSLPDKDIDLIKQEIAGRYLKKEEGHIKALLNNNQDQTINTYIRSNPNWVLKVNGQKQDIDNSDVFLKFYLQEGEQEVELKYIPKDFYAPTLLTLILTPITLLIIYRHTGW